jgi:hypothetical protein
VPGWRAAAIERLELRGDGYTLVAAGDVAFEGSDLMGQLRLDAEGFDVADALVLWPRGVANDARAWIAANLPGGASPRPRSSSGATARARASPS